MYQINYIAPELQKDTSLSLSARCVLGRIGGLTQRGNKPCFASNDFLANECGLGKVTIQKALNELKNKEIIDTKITLYKGKKTRYIYLVYEPQNKKINSSHSELSDNSLYAKADSQNELSNNSHSELSSIYREKDNRARIERDRKTHSLSFDFNSIFSAMNEIKNEFTDYVFTDEEIRENAQSYLDKSQGYKFYKGKPTEAKLKAWLTQYLKQKKEKTSVVSGSGDLAKRISAMNQINEMMSKRSHTEKKSDPIDADFEIIDEQKKRPRLIKAGQKLEHI